MPRSQTAVASVHIELGEALVRKSLARQIYDAVERAILEGKIPPATRLGEEAVAAAFQVSRSPARETITELERAGLAERLLNRDRRVTVPTEAFIRDTFEVWRLLETERLYAASLAVTPAQLERIRTLLTDMNRLEGSPDSRRLKTAIAKFHASLQEGCPNQQLHRAANDWYKYIQWFRNLYFDYMNEMSAGGVDDHNEIVDCFTRKDRDGIVEVMRHHLERHRDLILSAWRRSSAPVLAASTNTIEFAFRAG